MARRPVSDGERAIIDDMSREDEPAFYPLRDEIRRATKHHHCDACEGTIQPGEKYHLFVYKEEGKFRVTKTHYYNCIAEQYL